MGWYGLSETPGEMEARRERDRQAREARARRVEEEARKDPYRQAITSGPGSGYGGGRGCAGPK